MRKLVFVVMMLLWCGVTWAQTAVPTSVPSPAWNLNVPIPHYIGPNAGRALRDNFNACVTGDPRCSVQLTPNLGGATVMYGAPLSQISRVVYPEAYGASHSTTVISGCSITSGTAVLSCGANDFAANQGVRVEQGGPASSIATAGDFALSIPVAGGTTYTYAMCAADPWGGFPLAPCAQHNTATGPNTLGLGSPVILTTFTGTWFQTNDAIALIYRKIGAGSWQFITTINGGTAFTDLGFTPTCSATGCGWPTSPPGGAINDDLFSYVVSMSGTNMTLHDNAGNTLTGGGIVHHDNSRAINLGLAAAAGGQLSLGPFTYLVDQSSLLVATNPPTYSYTHTNAGCCGAGILQIPSNTTIAGAGKSQTFLVTDRALNQAGQSYTFGFNQGLASVPNYWGGGTPANCPINNAPAGANYVTTSVAGCAASTFNSGDWILIEGGHGPGGGPLAGMNITQVLSTNSTGMIFLKEATDIPFPTGIFARSSGTQNFNASPLAADSNAGFPSSGTLIVGKWGAAQLITYTGLSGNNFTGTSGGTGASLPAGSPITLQGPAGDGLDNAGISPIVYNLSNDIVHDVTIRDLSLENWSGYFSGNSPVYNLRISNVATPWTMMGNQVFYNGYYRHLTLDHDDIQAPQQEFTVSQDVTIKDGSWIGYGNGIEITEFTHNFEMENETITQSDTFCPPNQNCSATTGTGTALQAYANGVSNIRILNNTIQCAFALSNATETAATCLDFNLNSGITGYAPNNLIAQGNTIITNAANVFAENVGAGTGIHFDKNVVIQNLAAENPIVTVQCSSGTCDGNYIRVNGPAHGGSGYGVIVVQPPASPVVANRIAIRENAIDVEAGGQDYEGIALYIASGTDPAPVNIEGNYVMNVLQGLANVSGWASFPAVYQVSNSCTNCGSGFANPAGTASSALMDLTITSLKNTGAITLPPPTVPSITGSVNLNIGTSAVQRFLQTGAVTATLTGLSAGADAAHFYICENGTGGFSLAFTNTIRWSGGSAPAHTTTANKCDDYGFLYDGTDIFGYFNANF